MPEALQIAWCGDPARARELADFFARNVGPEFISHGELQGPRALSPDTWRADLPEILRNEIEPRLAETGDKVPGAESRPVLVAETAGALAAVSLVTFSGTAPVPFAIVEDLVVDPRLRSRGIGKAVLDRIAAEARARDIGRLFLESGRHNHRAHAFFEREGFAACSIVMMRDLPVP